MENTDLALIFLGMAIAIIIAVLYYQSDTKTEEQLAAEKERAATLEAERQRLASMAAQEKVRADSLQAEKNANDFILTTPLWGRPYYGYPTGYPFYYGYPGTGGHHWRGGRRHR